MTEPPRPGARPEGDRPAPTDSELDRAAGHVAVLCNPLSGRASKRIGLVRRTGKELAGRSYREARTGDEIAREVEAVLDEGYEILVLVGGDGTIQATLTALDTLRPGGDWPRLAVVPGGNANMTAKDLGAGGDPVERLEALRAWLEEGEPEEGVVVERPVLRVERAPAGAVSGMFFGAGVVAAGVRYFRERLRGLNMTGERVSALAVGRVLLDLAFGGEAGRAASQPIVVSVDGRTEASFRGLLCLASTLERLLLNTRPYWGEGEGPIRFTLVEEEARALWRSLPRLATGRAGDVLTPDRGYHSRSCRRVEMKLEGGFVLDGELFQAPDEGGTLVLSAPRVAEWLVP